MFGQNPIYGQISQTPPLPGMTPEMAATAAAPTAPSGGMFGAGGVGRSIAGMIGDFLLQRAGMQPIYQPTMMEKWKHQQELADYNRKRADDNTDFQTKRQFEVDHPLPTSNDTANDYAFWQQHLSPDQFTQWLQKQYDPEVSVPLPGGSMYVGPRSGMAGALGGGHQSAPPTAPVGNLKPYNPGGPTPGASGGFPQ